MTSPWLHSTAVPAATWASSFHDCSIGVPSASASIDLDLHAEAAASGSTDWTQRR